jgi:hypothetical protein
VPDEIFAKFEVTGWKEHQFDRRAKTAKLTTARVGKSYSGDIEGDSVTEWLMSYSDDKSAEFVGLERINGTIAGRTGTFVLRHVGKYQDGVATAELVVVEGSGSGDLAKLSGQGDFTADPAGQLRLNVTFG